MYLYPLVPIVVTIAYAARWGGTLYYVAAMLGAFVWGSLRLAGVPALRELIVGLDKIAWGVAFFLLAMMASLAKAGLWNRWRTTRCYGPALKH